MTAGLGSSIPLRALGGALLWALVAGCASQGARGYSCLSETMEPPEVQALWGAPSSVYAYDDSEGHHIRWEYHRSAVAEQRYWSLESRPAGRLGYTTTAVRRGRPYAQRYLAAWVVFIEGKVGRWQSYLAPAEPPGWLRSGSGIQSRSSSSSTYP